MERKIVMLEIRDSDDGLLLDKFLVINPTKKALAGLQDLIDGRFNDDGLIEDWDYSCVYDYILSNFEIVGYSTEVIDY